MADPRSTISRRAALSNERLKELTAKSGFRWPDLLINDYQGIIQDSVFLADEIDDLELVVIDNTKRIGDVELRLDDLEARIFKTVIINSDYLALPFQVVLCDNNSPIEVTLITSAVKDDMIHVMRKNEQVTTLGLIDDDNTGRIFNVKYQSELYIFDGTGWNAI